MKLLHVMLLLFLVGCASQKPREAVPKEIVPPVVTKASVPQPRVVLIGTIGPCKIYRNTVTGLITTNCPVAAITNVVISVTAKSSPSGLGRDLYGSTNLLHWYYIGMIGLYSPVVRPLSRTREFYRIQ